MVNTNEHNALNQTILYDAIIVGSGIGGLVGACCLAKEGKKVLVLEANYLPGGCCSSYWRKGFVFETGATTLMGFDEHQPFHTLQKMFDLDLNLVEINPAMTVWLDGKKIIRPKNFDQWLTIAQQTFGNSKAQAKFWRKAFELSNFVWKASAKNLTFPPTSFQDLLQLAISNSPFDVLKLKYAFISTQKILESFELADNEPFIRFLDQQLLITAQSTVNDTPFLFAAPALCYTNYKNYYLPGGMIQLPFAFIQKLGQLGGDLRLRQRVTKIYRENNIYQIKTENGNVYSTHQVLSNVPIWNLPALICNPKEEGKPITKIKEQNFNQQLQSYTKHRGEKINDYASAFTMGIVVKDNFPYDFTLHHQIILPDNQLMVHCGSGSVFVSMSARGDALRTDEGLRILAISTHAHQPQKWFEMNKETYQQAKFEVTNQILQLLTERLPTFCIENIEYQTASTPVTWRDWIFRADGNVGGVPQRMDRKIWDFIGAKTPYENFFLCGDSVYPGQGAPGVALGGIIAARRMME